MLRQRPPRSVLAQPENSRTSHLVRRPVWPCQRRDEAEPMQAPMKTISSLRIGVKVKVPKL